MRQYLLSDKGYPMNLDEYDQLLDVSGLNCPLPVLKAKAALARMSDGEILKVIVTHPDSQQEFSTLCRLPNLDLLESVEEDDSFIYRIKKLY